MILQGNKLERSFAGQVLFENITLQIGDKDRIALVGRNGAGKSTLLKILVGEEQPSSGTIDQKRELNLSYLAQDSRFASEKTIFDEMLHVFEDLRQDEQQLRQMETEMGQLSGDALSQLMTRYDQLTENFRQRGGFTYESDIKTILNAFKFGQEMWQMPISELSGGQNTRLALAKMLLEKPDLLVLDEPTNHLDIETIAWLENYLVHYSGALLIVSHDRYFLDKVATVTMDLRPHGLDVYAGNYSYFIQEKAQRLATEEKNFEKQQKEIAKLEDFVQKNIVRASTTKRAQSRRKQLEKMERLEKPDSHQRSAYISFHADRPSGNKVLSLKDTMIGHEGEPLSGPIDLDVSRMDAIAVVGPNGIGKSTLIKSIIGEIPFVKGSAMYGANVDQGYYDQTQSHLTPQNTVLEEIWSDFSTLPEVEVRNRLGAFLFSGEDVKKTVSVLSGGEKARLLLAKLSLENNNFLILDEPTNHLDIDSKEVLENALIDFDGTLLFVSHDRYFINRVANKVLEISQSGSQLYLGDYDYYLEKKAEQEQKQMAADTASDRSDKTAAQDYQAQKASQKEVRRINRRLEEIEVSLEALDDRAAALHAEMSQTNDATALMDLQKEVDQIAGQQDDLWQEWEDLSEKLES